MNKLHPPADFDDNPEWTDADFAKAKPSARALVKRGRPVGTTSSSKKQIALRVDTDVIETFKSTGPGWQTRMNEALRTRIDVTYSRPLKGWLVTINRPMRGVAGRAHEILGKFDDRAAAETAAHRLAALEPLKVPVKVWENA